MNALDDEKDGQSDLPLSLSFHLDFHCWIFKPRDSEDERNRGEPIRSSSVYIPGDSCSCLGSKFSWCKYAKRTVNLLHLVQGSRSFGQVCESDRPAAPHKRTVGHDAFPLSYSGHVAS